MSFASFVVLAGMRTGSNLLEAHLNALPGVTCHGEAYNPGFVCRLGAESAFGMTLADRNADPLEFLRRLQRAEAGLNGFRYFPDHDRRVFPAVMDDADCAKIVLTRHPLDRYISWKIARATGQWKLVHAARHRSERVVFDEAEFRAFLERHRRDQSEVLLGLQQRGQAAFWIGYEDLADPTVLAGLAAFLGVPAAAEAPETRVLKQNPGALREKVTNPEAMAAALARLDWIDLDHGPDHEPRRRGTVPSFRAAGPLLFMPVTGGPTAEIAGWLAAVGPVETDFSPRGLRRWRAAHPGHRSFTVLRHPVARAWAALSGPVMGGSLPEIRRVFARTMQLDLPRDVPLAAMPWADRQAIFLAFLRFAAMNLSGQTSARVDAGIATQAAALEAFALHGGPDVVLRESRLAEGLAFLAGETGAALPPVPHLPASPETDLFAAPEIVAAARTAYARDYAAYGFGD